MRSLLIVIPFVLADWTLCVDAAVKRGGGRAFPAVDDKRGGGRAFQLNDDEKRGGGRAFGVLSEKKAGGRTFPLAFGGEDSTGKRAFDESFEKRAGGRAFFLYDRNINNNLIKRPGAMPVSSYSSFSSDGISPYNMISDGWYRRKRPGARPFFGGGSVYTKKGGGRGFVVDSDEYSD